MKITDEELMEQMRLIHRVAYKMTRDCRSYSQDVESAGLLALVQAVAKYDPSKKASLRTYVAIRTRGAMIDYLRKHGPYKRIQRTKPVYYQEVSIDGMTRAQLRKEHLA